jgi:dipeptidyl aminopeptidase/acylaminoacyl peptidase
MNTAFRPLAAAALILSMLGTTSAQTAGPIPIDAFFDEGEVLAVRLSPSGRWLARQVKPDEKTSTRLIVVDLEDKTPPLAVAAFEKARVDRFRWVSDDLLLAWVDEDRYRGPDSRGHALISVRRDGESIRRLINSTWRDVYSSPGVAPLEGNHAFLSLGKPGTEEIVVGYMGETAAELAAGRVVPLVVNARTGTRRTLLDKTPEGVSNWLFDSQGRARVGFAYANGQVSYHWHDPAAGSWRVLGPFDDKDPPYTPLHVTADGKLYVTVSSHGGTGEEVRLFDFAAGRPGTEALASTPGYSRSITPVVRRETGEVIGWDMQVDALTPVWLSAADKAVQDRVDDVLKGRINLLQCRPARCADADVILIYSFSDRAPGDYVLHRPKANSWQRIGSSRPRIDPAAMAPVDFQRIKARDGADLPVWVTLPRGGPKAKPAVVLVHGGPWLRGRQWGWSAESQFLASRGYVVIEPEFRGSEGYGVKHFKAGFRQWGQAMQDDVSDALKFAVDKGWVDPKRVCIAGASYGGYATLMGLAKDPGQYRCGVAWVAVSDPELMFTAHWSDVSAEAKRHGYATMIGDPKADAAMFAANSPLKQAAKIKAPVLLAYGSADRRVPIEHGEYMRKALIDSGNPPEWVVYADEPHGFFRPENWRDFYGRMERFLARHLAP